VKFQDQIFSKYQDNFRTLSSVSRGSRHRKCTFFLCSQILISQADQYCSHKNVTKAMLHIKQWTVSVTVENSTGHSTSAI